MEICSCFTGMERKDGAFLLHTDNADVKVCFVTDEIVRVRASFDHLSWLRNFHILMTTSKRTPSISSCCPLTARSCTAPCPATRSSRTPTTALWLTAG